MMFFENDYCDNVLWDQNSNDPFFDLEEIIIPKDNFDPRTPVQIINRDLAAFETMFTVAHFNARSLNKNINELKAIIDKTNFDVICISESWLQSRTPRDRFHIEGFNIFRMDRKNKRGGGVCIYVRDHYLAKKIKLPKICASPEMIWVEVEVNHQKVAIGNLYKPPKIPCKTFYEAYESLLYIYSKYDEPILTGDFNVNMLNQDSGEVKLLQDSILEPFALTQLIKSPTRVTETSSTLLDLILVKSPEKVLFSGCCDTPGVSDHFATYFAYRIKKPKFKPVKLTRRSFKNFDVNGFLAAAELAHFENVFAVSDVNSKVTVFENTVNQLLDEFAPYNTFTVRKQNSTPWITEEIQETMDKRDMFKDHFNNTKKSSSLKNFKTLRNKITSMMRSSQRNYFNECINSNITNSKDFFQQARKLNLIPEKQTKSSVNFSAQTLNDTFLLNNNAPIDNDFIQQKLNQLYARFSPSIHSFSLTDVSELDVIKVMKSIKSLSVGVDGINSYVLKLLAPRICSVLVDIINTSFHTGIFPDRWKKAIIKPIPKVAVPLAPSDFRPISLLCTLSKIIEKLVNKQIVAYLVEHSFLDPYQSAYRKNHSTQTALLKLTEDVLDTIDDSEVTLLVLLDFSKAFDTINHTLLLAKLDILGFDQNVCKWVKSYLSGRQQSVHTDKEKSNWSPVINGVPQGSILGPLLFTILISDMRVSIWSGSYISYADDTNLYWESSVNDINETISEANSVLDKVSLYCTDNILRLNEGKSKYLIIGTQHAIRNLKTMQLDPISINNKHIEKVSHAKLLGVTIDEILSWRKKVNLDISKAMGNFVRMSRYKRFLDSSSKIILCESLVLSLFNYCNIVTCNMEKYLENKIQKVQNLCIRFIFDIKSKDRGDYTFYLKKLGWLNMRQRAIKQGLTLIYKIINGLAPCYLQDSFTMVNEIHNVNTRNRSNCNIYINKQIKTKLHRNSYTCYFAKVFNLLPENIKVSVSVNSFKSSIHKHMLNEQLVLP